MSKEISIKGARVHNLKNIDINIPRDKFVVITGLSGSGKSSLAFDTIYAEGQRRYVESLSSYARQFLNIMDKPEVDQIEGLSPAISIDQNSSSRNPRSTVGTTTEIYDHLRLLFARIGIPHCLQCSKKLIKQNIKEITEKVWSLPLDTDLMIFSPIVREKKGEHRKALERVAVAGYKRLRLDGEIINIKKAQDIILDKKKKHNIEIVVEHINNDKEKKTKERLAQVLAQALDLGNGFLIVNLTKENKDLNFSEYYSCPNHNDINLTELEPRNFSFNSPQGACQTCAGLGTNLIVDADLVIPNKRLSLAEGAIRPWSRTASNQSWYTAIIEAVAKKYKFSTRVPVAELKEKHLTIILDGTGEEIYKLDLPNTYKNTFAGVIANLKRRHKETDSDYIRSEIERYMRVYTCPSCQGKRLNKEVLTVTFLDKNISEISLMSIKELTKFFLQLDKKLNKEENLIARPIIKAIKERLKFLNNVGLDYLSLNRSANTLSGGEAQRIRLATQIGTSLIGVLYILDEPSIGLHQRDNKKLILALKKLRDSGNSVIVVEHDEETILSADHIIDIGPGAGKEGGEIIFQGSAQELAQDTKSLTGQYLNGKKSVFLSKAKRKGNGKYINILGASEFNLKNIDIELPLGRFISITGVSGSGKSTLVTEILAKKLAQHFYKAKAKPGKHKEIKGLENIDKVINIDQSPIGKTPRSNPATYTGVFTYIRELFAELKEAKLRGYKAGRFSFNVRGGRCEVCQGDGSVKIEMNFLANVYIECKECHGKRYNPEALEIHYKEKDISEILEMTAAEATSFFRDSSNIYNKLKVLVDVGLGYIRLGQPANTLSGGEAQRIKLATELSRRSSGKTLYILDEPTTGLHFDDVKRLLYILHRLADKGNTVIVVEHNLDVIKHSDYLIDLGPEGGEKGGYIVAAGKPEEVAKVKKSYTGQYLSQV